MKHVLHMRYTYGLGAGWLAAYKHTVKDKKRSKPSSKCRTIRQNMTCGMGGNSRAEMAQGKRQLYVKLQLAHDRGAAHYATSTVCVDVRLFGTLRS
jgi:hypothetical protein